MKRKIFVCALAFSAFLFGGANSGGEKKPGTDAGGDEKSPGWLQQVEIPREPFDVPQRSGVNMGGAIQISMFSRNGTRDELRTLKVEIKGDSLAMVIPVVEVPVWTTPQVPPKVTPVPYMDRRKKQLSFFLNSVKVGETVVKITPIGMDGKARPVREITLDVVPAKK